MGQEKGIVAKLFHNYTGELKGFLRRKVQWENDVEDVLQEAYLKLWRQEQDDKLRSDAKSYLYKTAINVTRDNFRRDQVRKIDQHIEFNEELYFDEYNTPEKSMILQQGIECLEESLRTLPRNCRVSFLFYHVKGMSVKDISVRINVTTRTVERHLAKALLHCSKEMENFWDEEK